MRFAFLSAMIFISMNIIAQEKFSLMLDVGGTSPYASINIDKGITGHSGSGIHFRLGAGIVGYDVVEPPTFGFSRTYIKWQPSIPAGVSYLFGHNKRNKFEIAAQAVYVFKMTVPEIWDKELRFRSELSNEFIPSIFFGYRAKMFREKAFMRAGYNPLFLDSRTIHWLAFSFGWTFMKKANKKD